jgi:hypothetical protein
LKVLKRILFIFFLFSGETLPLNDEAKILLPEDLRCIVETSDRDKMILSQMVLDEEYSDTGKEILPQVFIESVTELHFVSDCPFEREDRIRQFKRFSSLKRVDFFACIKYFPPNFEMHKKRSFCVFQSYINTLKKGCSLSEFFLNAPISVEEVDFSSNITCFFEAGNAFCYKKKITETLIKGFTRLTNLKRLKLNHLKILGGLYAKISNTSPISYNPIDEIINFMISVASGPKLEYLEIRENNLLSFNEDQLDWLLKGLRHNFSLANIDFGKETSVAGEAFKNLDSSQVARAFFLKNSMQEAGFYEHPTEPGLWKRGLNGFCQRWLKDC